MGHVILAVITITETITLVTLSISQITAALLKVGCDNCGPDLTNMDQL